MPKRKILIGIPGEKFQEYEVETPPKSRKMDYRPKILNRDTIMTNLMKHSGQLSSNPRCLRRLPEGQYNVFIPGDDGRTYVMTIDANSKSIFPIKRSTFP